jgi:hypothetical protein
MTKKELSEVLTPMERTALFGLSLAALVIAVCATIYPVTLQTKTTTEYDSSSKTIKSTVTEVTKEGRKEITVLLATFGFLGFLLGINRGRFSKIAFATASIEIPPALKAAKEAAKKNLSIKEISIESKPPEGEMTPLFPPVGDVTLSQKKVSVFSLDAVPERVVKDAREKWSSSSSTKPQDLSTLEFAARQQGKGNQPWILKFAGSDPIKVLYNKHDDTDEVVNEQD